MAESGTTRPQGTVRNLIRSQARRKPKNARESPHQVKEKVPNIAARREPSNAPLDFLEIGSYRLPDPHRTRGNHVLDPFSSLPSVALGELKVSQELLRHCRSTVLGLHILPIMFDCAQKAHTWLLRKFRMRKITHRSLFCLDWRVAILAS